MGIVQKQDGLFFSCPSHTHGQKEGLNGILVPPTVKAPYKFTCLHDPTLAPSLLSCLGSWLQKPKNCGFPGFPFAFIRLPAVSQGLYRIYPSQQDLDEVPGYTHLAMFRLAPLHTFQVSLQSEMDLMQPSSTSRGTQRSILAPFMVGILISPWYVCSFLSGFRKLSLWNVLLFPSVFFTQ